MKRLLLLVSFVAVPLFAQDEKDKDHENAVNGEDIGPVMPEQQEHFDILQLPKGASVVLPHPAATVVPLNLKVQVSSTDKKQILKIGAVSDNGSTKIVRIAIYDQHQQRVKYLDIRPGSYVIYSFKNLNSIQIVPQNAKDPALRQTKLLLESDRPLGVSY